MATKKQKQDLMQALKFTPRDIQITLYGYGGEIVLGRIPEEAYDYWEGREDLADFAYDWDGDFEDVPADARFITDGAWHDIDDICHENGCELSDVCAIEVMDMLENREIWGSNLDLNNLDAKGVDTQNHMHYRPQDNEPDGTCVFVGQSFEKGTFFSGTVRITAPFDPAKLSITWVDCDGWRLVTGVDYDGEDVEGYDGYSTTGKSTHFEVYQVERDQEEWDPRAELEKIDVPLIEGEEMWAQEAIDSAEPEIWEGIPLTHWWPGNEHPVHKGEYEIFEEGSKWPFPTMATWNGRSWKIKEEEVSVRIWRGLTRPAD